MKKFFIQRLFLILTLSCVLLHCSKNAGDDNDVGTIINNPQLPAGSVVPDFDSYLPDTSLEAEAADADTILALTTSDIPTVWQTIFESGGVAEARFQRRLFETFGDAVGEALESAGISEATGTVATATTEEVKLVETTSTWTVEVVQEATDDEYVRLYFTNDATGFYQGTYIFKTDADGIPSKGGFIFVNPELLSEGVEGTTEANKRLVAFTFDFTTPGNNLFVLRAEQYFLAGSGYYSFHVHYHCDAPNCIGEYNETLSQPSDTEFGYCIRFSWDEDDNAVYLAAMGYPAGTNEVENPIFNFIGPQTPEASEVIEVDYNFDTPPWAEKIYTVDDLPGHAGTDHDTALEYYGDGTSTAGWDLFTPALVDTWLDASDFDG